MYEKGDYMAVIDFTCVECNAVFSAAVSEALPVCRCGGKALPDVPPGFDAAADALRQNLEAKKQAEAVRKHRCR